jgi:hydrogenase nickel incorporation protein HypB
LGTACPAAVVVGDLATARDAERLRATGVPVVQITTGTVCHLDAEMVARGLEQLDLDGCRCLFLENVGNLVCPADFDLGEDARVAIISVTEGEDKPLKYPPLFRSAHAVVITKTDVAAVAGTDLAALRGNIATVSPQAAVFELSARTGEGMEPWLAWLRNLAGR